MVLFVFFISGIRKTILTTCFLELAVRSPRKTERATKEERHEYIIMICRSVLEMVKVICLFNN